MKKQEQQKEILTPHEAFAHFVAYKNRLSRTEITDLYKVIRVAWQGEGRDMDVRKTVSDAIRDFNGKRKGRNGKTLPLGEDRIALILNATGLYEYVSPSPYFIVLQKSE
jgi:hypothetical protein